MFLLFYRWDPERSKNLSRASQEAVQNQKLSSHPPSSKHTPLILLRQKHKRKPLSHSQEHHRIYTHSFSLIELQHFHFFVCLLKCYPSLVIISSPFFLGIIWLSLAIWGYFIFTLHWRLCEIIQMAFFSHFLPSVSCTWHDWKQKRLNYFAIIWPVVKKKKHIES